MTTMTTRTAKPEDVEQAVRDVLAHHQRAPQNGSIADKYTLLADIARRVLELGLEEALSGLRELPLRCAECGHTEGATWGSCRACESWRWAQLKRAATEPPTHTPWPKP